MSKQKVDFRKVVKTEIKKLKSGGRNCACGEALDFHDGTGYCWRCYPYDK